jgi:hypothetical protein
MDIITFNECVGDCAIFGKELNPFMCQFLSLLGILFLIIISFSVFSMIYLLIRNKIQYGVWLFQADQ